MFFLKTFILVYSYIKHGIHWNFHTGYNSPRSFSFKTNNQRFPFCELPDDVPLIIIKGQTNSWLKISHSFSVIDFSQSNILIPLKSGNMELWELLCFCNIFLPKPSLGAHTLYGLSFCLRIPIQVLFCISWFFVVNSLLNY